MIKIIPKKKKFRKAKWLSEEAEQIAEKIREVKGKREKERYTNLNTEFHIRERRWMKLEPIIQSEVSQKEKHQYSILTHIYGI